MPTFQCEMCPTMFSARPADRKRGWARCCSKSCAAKKSNKQTGKYQTFLAKKNQGFALPPNVSLEQYERDRQEHGGIPQYNARGEYEGFRMSIEDLSYGGYGDADVDTPFGDGKW